jgi:hypothetical protein
MRPWREVPVMLREAYDRPMQDAPEPADATWATSGRFIPIGGSIYDADDTFKLALRFDEEGGMSITLGSDGVFHVELREPSA